MDTGESGKPDRCRLCTGLNQKQGYIKIKGGPDVKRASKSLDSPHRAA
jgi:hypothetical protein